MLFLEICCRNTNSRPLNHTINLEAPKVGTKIDSHYDINVNQPAIGVDLLSVLFGELQAVSNKRFQVFTKFFTI